jgi:Ca-activated chloride channel family protein
LVVVTDGEAHDTLPGVVRAAERLRRDRVRLILVGEGTTEPSPIPVRDPEGGFIDYQRDPAGEMVVTWRRDEVLTRTADAAHGVLVAADLSDQAGAVRDIVTAYKRAPQASSTAERDISRAWMPLLAAALVLLLHTLTRRSAALAGILLVCAAGTAAAQGPVNRGDDAWRRGAFREAAEWYLRQIQRGEGGDTAVLNFGTAAMALGDTAAADRALTRAAASLDPEIRFRALYNLGLLALRRGLADSTAGRRGDFIAAVEYYRQALLLRPGHQAAQWNLELATRNIPPEEGGAGQPPGAGGAGEPPPATPPPPSGISASQAAQILNSMAEEELRTLLDRNRRRSQNRVTRGRKEW